MKARLLSCVVFLMLCVAVGGQEVVVGSVDGGTTPSFNTGKATFINLAESADTDGSLTTAVVRFGSNGTCSGTFRLRFYRADGGGLAMIADRGPFLIEPGTKVISLNPPVDVARKDLIGLYQDTNGRCGLAATYGGKSDTFLRVESDFRGGPLVSSYDIPRGFRYAFRASSQRLVLAGVIPAVGNQQGAFGSQFRTTFQVTNPDDGESLQGLTFVFHPRGVVGTSADPSTTLDAAPNATRADDLLARMNVTGVGSLDVYTPLWSPVMTARVYNDTGSGTNGLSEALMPTSRALHNGEHGRIVFPSDLTNYRMNVGIRTLGRDITLSAEQRNADGSLIANFSRTYRANYFDQVSLSSFAQEAVTEGGSIIFQVLGGDVILYTTTTDNRTNDSAITIVTRD